MFGAGHLPELIIIGVVIIIFFGGKRIAGLGQGLGQGIRDFRNAVRPEEPKPEDKPAES